jgi:putative spermidine/putrescine transport system substrate-binding protein
MQAKLAVATYSLPTNKDAPAPSGMPSGLTIYPVDWKFVADNRADWVKRWDRDMAM